jgi:crossover junction endodeoxyribonuclease RusA
LQPEQWHAKLPVSLTLTFVFARPKAHFRANAPQHCVTRIGDLDKLCRAVCDALTGIAYDDDSQVFSINAERRYATASESPGALITITTIDV